MKFPNLERRKQADKGNVLEFAQSQGIELKRVGRDSFRGVEHDSLVITPSKNAWSWNSRSTGGFGARTFAERYILADENIDLATKANKAVEMVESANVSEGASHIKRERFRYSNRQESRNFSKANDYLTKVRKLDPTTVRKLNQAGLIKQDKQGNVMFMWRDPLNKNKVVGVSVQGTTIDYDKYGKRGTLKRIERNSDSKMGWSFDVNTNGKAPKNLVFCESSIDAISYYDSARKTGHKLDSTRIVSMEGLKQNTVKNYIEITQAQLTMEGKKLTSVRFGVDRDEAGTTFIQKMRKEQEQAVKAVNQRQKNTNNDSFTKDMEILQKYLDRENEILAQSPKFISSQPPKQARVKDWNDFAKKLNKGSLIVVSSRQKSGRNLNVEKKTSIKENLSKTQQYKQYLASQQMSMN